MKITILQGAFLPVPSKLGGAVEKRWYILGKYFAQKGHDVVHISRLYGNLPKKEICDGVLYKRTRGFSVPSSGIWLKVLDLIYTLRAKYSIPNDTDIIVSNTFWAPLLLSPALRKKCIVDVARMPKGQLSFYSGVARLRGNSNQVVKAIKKEIGEEQYKKVIMIPNPIPFDNFSNVNLKLKKNIILYVGRIHPEKGLEILIKAFRNITGNDWKLKIVGPFETSSGGGGTNYFNSLKDLAGDANIEFIGPVFDMDRLNDFYIETAIFSYPSIAEQGETFGLAPLESMAWGCVPLVSDLECFRDFIKNGINGLVFDHRSANPVKSLEEQIIKLQIDENLRASLAIKSLEVQKSHSVSHISDLFLDEFEHIKNKNNSDR